MGAWLRRGLLAGLAAGVAAGIFHFLVSEPVIEQALRFEPPSGTDPVVSRTGQRAGLVLAFALWGVTAGGLHGLAYGLLDRRRQAGTVEALGVGRADPWGRSLRLAAIAFAVLWLVPFLKYPTNPPGVGDPATAGERTASYLVLLACSVAAAAAALTSARRLADLGVPRHRRQALVAAGYLAVIGTLYALLPPGPDASAIPAGIVWDLRVRSAAGQALLWLLLGAVFGALALRAAARAEDGARVPAVPAPGRGPDAGERPPTASRDAVAAAERPGRAAPDPAEPLGPDGADPAGPA